MANKVHSLMLSGTYLGTTRVRKMCYWW